jgi:hypothetical protein
MEKNASFRNYARQAGAAQLGGIIGYSLLTEDIMGIYGTSESTAYQMKNVLGEFGIELDYEIDEFKLANDVVSREFDPAGQVRIVRAVIRDLEAIDYDSAISNVKSLQSRLNAYGKVHIRAWGVLGSYARERNLSF